MARLGGDKIGHSESDRFERSGAETANSIKTKENMVDVTGIEPATPCLQSRPGKILTALSGVAYTETDKILALSNVPKLSRTRPKEQRGIAKLTANSSFDAVRCRLRRSR